MIPITAGKLSEDNLMSFISLVINHKISAEIRISGAAS